MNLLDLAAIAVPKCFTQKQMPFGITVFSGAFSDQKLLTLSERIQQKTQLSLGATEYTYQASSSALAGSKVYSFKLTATLSFPRS